MNRIGVIEGFFGSQWPLEARLSYAPFLQRYGGDFYIYAPKQDARLRKKWRDPWDAGYLTHLGLMARHFHQYGIRFGVGFSPFGLGPELTAEDALLLQEKLSRLNDLGIDILGLFFDDMPSTENLASTQIKAVSFVRAAFKKEIIFCPSYYTPDPILDKVFGPRPLDYLDELARSLPAEIELAWTGPKVISPEIPAEHLRQVSVTLRRKPFIWENLFANDGPKNCKFLKLKPFSGRTSETFAAASGFGFNMMNQPEISKITYLAAKNVMEGLDAEAAYAASLDELCTREERTFILKWNDQLLKSGLDSITPEDRLTMGSELSLLKTSIAKEMCQWLNGEYNVGSECLTD